MIGSTIRPYRLWTDGNIRDQKPSKPRNALVSDWSRASLFVLLYYMLQPSLQHMMRDIANQTIFEKGVHNFAVTTLMRTVAG